MTNRPLKPRLIEIQETVARDAGVMVTQEELDADIAAAKAEYRAKLPPRRLNLDSVDRR